MTAGLDVPTDARDEFVWVPGFVVLTLSPFGLDASMRPLMAIVLLVA